MVNDALKSSCKFCYKAIFFEGFTLNTYTNNQQDNAEAEHMG